MHFDFNRSHFFPIFFQNLSNSQSVSKKKRAYSVGFQIKKKTFRYQYIHVTSYKVLSEVLSVGHNSTIKVYRFLRLIDS